MNEDPAEIEQARLDALERAKVPHMFPWLVLDAKGETRAERRTMADAHATVNRLRLTNPDAGPYQIRDRSVVESALSSDR